MIIAISTNKGGVLKTSLATNLAGVISKTGKKVLIVDTDNQGNVSLSFGLNPDNFKKTLYNVLVEGIPAKNVIQNVYENIDIIPSNDDMAFFEFDVLTNLKKYPQPFHLLRGSLKNIHSNYNYVLIDTPPNIGLTQGNVLAYADGVIIPFQPEVYSMRSLQKIMEAIRQFKEDHNPRLTIIGVVATLVDSRTVLHSQVLQECRRFCHENGIRMFETVIPRTIRYASSVAYENLPATLSDKENPLIQSYYQLWGELKNG